MSSRSFNTRRRLFIWSPVLLAYTAFVCTGLALWMLYGTFWRQQEQLLTQQVDEQVRLLETIGGSNNWDREKTLKDFVEFNASTADSVRPVSVRLRAGTVMDYVSFFENIPML